MGTVLVSLSPDNFHVFVEDVPWPIIIGERCSSAVLTLFCMSKILSLKHVTVEFEFFFPLCSFCKLLTYVAFTLCRRSQKCRTPTLSRSVFETQIHSVLLFSTFLVWLLWGHFKKMLRTLLPVTEQAMGVE